MDYDSRLEAAARRLCEIRGDNPEEFVRYSIPGDVTLACKRRALWKNIAEEIKGHVERIKINQLITEFDLV